MKKAKSKTTNLKAKSAKPKKSHASFYDRNELSKVLGIDGRTVNRRCSRLGISPEPAKPNKPIRYRLTSAQFESLRKPLRRNSSFMGDGSDLRQSKLAEEIEHLRLKNRKLREASTPNWFLAKLLKAMADRIPSIVENRLETYAVQGADREPAELRSLGKSTNDTIRADVHSFLEVWSAKWDDLATESRETA
jgi:hypothetical protein